jgi:hypothetical protein
MSSEPTPTHASLSDPKRPTYEKPAMSTYSEEELRDRFADIFARAAVFSDQHGSPGM